MSRPSKDAWLAARVDLLVTRVALAILGTPAETEQTSDEVAYARATLRDVALEHRAAIWKLQALARAALEQEVLAAVIVERDWTAGEIALAIARDDQAGDPVARAATKHIHNGHEPLLQHAVSAYRRGMMDAMAIVKKRHGGQP